MGVGVGGRRTDEVRELLALGDEDGVPDGVREG